MYYLLIQYEIIGQESVVRNNFSFQMFEVSWTGD